MTTYKIYPSEV